MTTRQEAIDAHFITATEEDQRSAARMEELRALAERTGKMLVVPPKKFHDVEQLEAALARRETLPSVKRGDNHAFLDNLNDIARGRAVVR